MRLLGVFLLPFALAFGQNVISVQAGLVHYVEGRVLLNGEPLEMTFGKFPQMKANGELRTEEGRAEVLMAPGTALRMSENSGFRILSTKLEDIRVEALSGSLLFEVAEMPKEQALTVIFQDQPTAIRKSGLYRFDSEEGRLRVYDGEARVGTINVKGSREMALVGGSEPEKFDASTGDALYRWSKRRSGYLAMANVYAANSLRNDRWTTSLWGFNRYFGMYTFVPYRGMYNSPFGYYYYSPRAVYNAVYSPPPVMRAPDPGWSRGAMYNPNLGYSTASRSAAPSVAPSASGPVAPSSGASSARTADSVSGRGGGGGRGQ